MMTRSPVNAHRSRVLAGSAIVAAAIALAPAAPAAADVIPTIETCGDFLSDDALAGFDATVTVAEEVLTAGVLNCRVVATISPAPDSAIGVEYRLPVNIGDGWNGRFLGLGGGNFGGSISAAAFEAPLARGYAVAQTDIGHKTADGVNWSLYPFVEGGPYRQHTDRVTDYTWRSVERMTVVGKAVVAAYYGREAETSFWQGCSTGGRQGLILAQRFPDYYDGIIVGAPVYTNYQQVRNLWSDAYVHAPADPQTGLVANGDRAGTPLTEAVRGAVTDRILTLFDERDGVVDGMIDNPLLLDWDPANAADGVPTTTVNGVALTEAEIYTILRTYDGPRLADGTLVYPGRVFGSESAWTQLGAHNVNGASPVMYRDMIKIDPFYDHLTFDLDTALPEWDAAFLTQQRDASNPDIRPFLATGGKLLMYHGWNDDAVAPQKTIEYLERVGDIVGEGVDDDVRLFMVPTMDHCSGGDGPNTFDPLSALESWYLQGAAPDRIVARNETRDLERPLCPYPQVARWTGEGATVEGSSADDFECVGAPTAAFSVGPNVQAGGSAMFDASGSTDPAPAGDPANQGLLATWDFTGDGIDDATGAAPQWSFPAGGAFPVTLTVRSTSTGLADSATIEVAVAAADGDEEQPPAADDPDASRGTDLPPDSARDARPLRSALADSGADSAPVFAVAIGGALALLAGAAVAVIRRRRAAD